MADTIKMYTTGNMSAADMASAPDEATGYPIENILDNNPDTYWKCTDGTAYRDLEIDLNSAKAVEALIIWVHNYTGITNARTAELYYSDDDSTYTFVSGSGALVDTDGPIRIRTSGLPTAAAHRYWRIRINGEAGGQIAEISGIWLCTLYQPSVANQLPEMDADLFANSITTSDSGRQFGAAKRSTRQYVFPRQFVFYSQADLDELRGAVNDCRGRLYPLFLQEASAQTDAVMCHFAEDQFAKNRMRYLEFRPIVTFISVPYIPAGSTY